MKSAVVPGAVFLAVLVVAFGLTALVMYARGDRGGGYTPPPSNLRVITDLPQAAYAPVSSAFAESPKTGTGVVLIDAAHGNDFQEQELAVLISRINARGFDVTFAGKKGFFGTFEFLSTRERLDTLEQGLRSAHALVVILPRDSYPPGEVELARQFVAKGGRVLLVGDPTRGHDVNSLARAFGIVVEDDYLYNLRRHESNFQNIFLTTFAPDPLTEGLTEVVFYAAAPVIAPQGLAFTDQDTASSLKQRQVGFTPLVRGADPRVVAVGDFTFMTDPFNAVADNNRLIANLADFLTQGTRVFHLTDFPFFFRESVDILVTRPQLLSSATAVENLLSEAGLRAQVRALEDLRQDTVFLGLYQDAQQLAHYLTPAGIQLDGTIRTPSIQELNIEGTALAVLQSGENRHVLLLLAETEGLLNRLVRQFRTGEFRGHLVSNEVSIVRFEG